MKCLVALFALLISAPVTFGSDECLLSEEHLGEQVSDQVRQVLADGQRAFGVNLVKTIFEVSL